MNVYPIVEERFPHTIVCFGNGVGKMRLHEREVVASIRIAGIKTQGTAVSQHGLSVFFQAIVGISQVLIAGGRGSRNYLFPIILQRFGEILFLVGAIAVCHRCCMAQQTRKGENQETNEQK